MRDKKRKRMADLLLTDVPKIPEVPDFYKKIFADKAPEFYNRM
jgi:hypothetical protein